MTEPHHSPQQHDDDQVGNQPATDFSGSGPSPTGPTAAATPVGPAAGDAAPSPTHDPAAAAQPGHSSFSSPDGPVTGPVPPVGAWGSAAPAHGAAPRPTQPPAGQAPYGSYPSGQTPAVPSAAAPQGWSRDSATDPGTSDHSTWARYQSTPPSAGTPQVGSAPQAGSAPQSGSAPHSGGAPQAGGAPQSGGAPQLGSGPQSGGAPQASGSGAQWAGWTPAAGRPQPTTTFPATSDDYARAVRGATAPPNITTAPRKRRARTVTAIIAATALALGAGFGGGVLASRVGNTAAPTQDNSLSPTTAGAEISNVLPGATGSVEAVANTMLPSVVSILAVGRNGSGEGSGVILTENGLILTNNHVVADAEQLTVRFNDGTTANATLVGATATDDLAVIQVEGVSGLTKATLGSSADLQVGQQVVAVGSPLGLSATVTTGIVSALNRPVRTGQTETDDTILNAVQTDAAINPGNSGGPLVDMNGHVIGINSAIATMSSDGTSQSGSIGVGFAIPIDQAYRIAQEIINTGHASRAVLGATVSDASSDSSPLSTGAELREITAGGGAETAGLQAGDIVTKIGDQVIESADALIAAVRSQQPGGSVSVTYVRGSQTSTVDVSLGTAAAD